MTQNDKLTEAVGMLAKIISERAVFLLDNDHDPQQLVNMLSVFNYQLLACIDPDELEQLP